MLNSLDFERIEERTLAPYAAHSSRSQGRMYPEEPVLYRTAFQRDRDRVVHSKSFRRLMHKTQVFVAYEGDHYRTRLTHTLEVAQIARHVARMLMLNEDLTEVIALAHDLGHTPFGHAGESTLDEMMKEHGGFEHNRQSRRVVELLEKKYIDFPGINLTYEARDGLTKHRSAHDHPEHTELGHPSLEARVVNVADEIAYNAHDLDDGLTSKLIPIKELEGIELWREATAYNQLRHTSLSDDDLHAMNVRYLIATQINDVVSMSDQNIARHTFKDIEAVYACGDALIEFSEPMQRKNQELRSFLMQRFYRHPKVVAMNKKAQAIIRALFAYYVGHPHDVPLRERFPQESIERVTADYIAGMTDTFAEKELVRCQIKL